MTPDAISIAEAIKSGIKKRTDGGQITHAIFATSLTLHVALEAIALELNVDVSEFKAACGVGQPLAYFI